MSEPGQKPAPLKRTVGLFGATVLGLGSIVGTGVFVSIAFAINVAGEWTPLAVLLAGLLALCNGLSSAQLAAAHPVSGGSYEYGYRYLNPALGFTAGWMFLVAKGASAATAAYGFAIYLSRLVPLLAETNPRIPALVSVVVLTGIVLSGLKRSARANAILVAVSVTALAVFVGYGLTIEVNAAPAKEPFEAMSFLHATALLFVAFTGYGRVATMGEEIRDPAKNIPIAVAMTVGVSALIYGAVALVLVRVSLGQDSEVAPLIDAVASSPAWLTTFIIVGAITAMLGVLMNLLLGLSRVVLAMARRGDLPSALSVIAESGESPNRAVLLVAVGISTLILVAGHPKMAWSLSALTVLIYYATANLCALHQPTEERRVPRIVSVAGLGGCASLVVFFPHSFLGLAVGLIVTGLIWHFVAQRLAARHQW